MPTALLILFGGRSMPNMLTIINENIELVAAIVSQDQKQHLQHQFIEPFEELIKEKNQKPRLDTSYIVDAFDLEKVYNTCLRVVADYADYDWIFNITAATKIMSLGAYRAATELKERGESVSCWYLDTLHGQVVSLVGRERGKQLFHIITEQYAKVYNCQLIPGILEDERDYCQEHWIPFTRYLVEHPHYMDLLKDVIKQIKQTPSKPGKNAGSRPNNITPATNDTYEFLRRVYEAGLLEDLQWKGDAITIKLSYLQYNFLKGPWLEAYIWDKASKILDSTHTSKLFSDCQWDLKIPNNDKLSEDKNQLDVTLIYNAQLLLIECKTGDEIFEAETIYKLDSIANLLGSRFVTKILVTSFPNLTELPALDQKAEGLRKSFNDMKNRAKESHIVVITRDDLLDIERNLTKQAIDPDYSRF